MEFPQEVYDIANAASRKHRDNAQRAKEVGWAKFQKMPDAEDIVWGLAQRGFEELVERCRSNDNRNVRGLSGTGIPADQDGKAKVIVLQSEAGNEIMGQWYSFSVAGTMLGDLTGETLPSALDHEASLERGHGFRRKLLERIHQYGVPKAKRVRDVLTEKQIDRIAKELDAKPTAKRPKAAGNGKAGNGRAKTKQAVVKA